MTYKVVSGSPMSGEKCNVAEYDDYGELRCNYDGYFSARLRTWRLYPARVHTCGTFGLIILPETRVGMSRAAVRQNEKPAQKTKKEANPPDNQIRLV